MRQSRSRFASVAVLTLVLGLLPSFAASVPRGPEVGSISGTVSNVDFSGFAYVAADRVGESIGPEKYEIDGDGSGQPVGYYDMDDLRPGDYRVRFFDEDGTRAWQWHPGTRDVAEATIFRVKAGKSIVGVDATLGAAGHIEGTVTFPPGTDSRHAVARVSAYYLDGTTWRPVPSVAAKAGLESRTTFRIGGLPSGTYRLHYDSRGGTLGTASGFLGGEDDAAASTPVQVVAGRTTRADLVPRLGGTLRGRVLTDGGSPLAGARVQMHKLNEDGEFSGRWGSDETDIGGRYEIDRLDTGKYAVFIEPIHPYQAIWSGGAVRDYTVFYPSRTTPPDDATLVHVDAEQTTTWRDEVVRRAGTLEGTVRDERGDPVEGIEVVARRGRDWIFAQYQSIDGIPLTAETGVDGHYSFGEQSSGPYTLTFRDPQGVYADPRYDTLEYSRGDPARLFEGRIVEAGQRNVADVTTRPLQPRVSDPTPVVGQSLDGSLTIAGASLAADPDAEWTWRRNGREIAAAERPTYRATTADRGARLTATVTSERGSKRVLHISPSTSAVSTSRPRITLAASSPRKGRVVLTVKASAAGVPRTLLDGRISIGRKRSGSDHLATRTMRDGSLVTTLTGQPKGRRTYTVKFLAATNRYTASTTVSRRVSVR